MLTDGPRLPDYTIISGELKSREFGKSHNSIYIIWWDNKNIMSFWHWCMPNISGTEITFKNYSASVGFYSTDVASREVGETLWYDEVDEMLERQSVLFNNLKLPTKWRPEKSEQQNACRNFKKVEISSGTIIYDDVVHCGEGQVILFEVRSRVTFWRRLNTNISLVPHFCDLKSDVNIRNVHNSKRNFVTSKWRYHLLSKRSQVTCLSVAL